MVSNQIRLCGIIRDPFYAEEREYDGRCYSTYISIPRNSGAVDVLPVVIPESLLGENVYNCIGRELFVIGEFRSRNRFDGEKRRLELFIFASSIVFCDDALADPKLHDSRYNAIVLAGTVCKPAIFRETPSGRKITDFLLAVSRNADDDRHSDYIPCICWQETAERFSDLVPGECIFLVGRAQSRQYVKHYDDGRCDLRVAYEISVKSMRSLGRVEDLQVHGKIAIPSFSPALLE